MTGGLEGRPRIRPDPVRPIVPVCALSRWSIVLTPWLVSVGLVACGTPAPPNQSRSPDCSHVSGFAVSVDMGGVGQSSQVDAASWFALHGGVHGIPTGRWREVDQGGHGATVSSGTTFLHAVQGAGGAWVVDSGKDCP